MSGKGPLLGQVTLAQSQEPGSIPEGELGCWTGNSGSLGGPNPIRHLMTASFFQLGGDQDNTKCDAQFTSVTSCCWFGWSLGFLCGWLMRSHAVAFAGEQDDWKHSKLLSCIALWVHRPPSPPVTPEYPALLIPRSYSHTNGHTTDPLGKERAYM